jgi:type IV secretory pathway TraG/TraD family ATPase VirD4
MEQCYRSLIEIKELNIWNTIRSWLFHSDLVSFELMVEKKVITFYVVTVEHYSQIVEKQITSFYSNAEIEPVDPVKIEKRDGQHIKAFYAYQKEPFWFPMQTYKKIENDPLNNLTNIFTKLEEDELGSIQIMIRPAARKYGKMAEKVGEAIFQGRKVGRNGIQGKIPIIGFLGDLLSMFTRGKDAKPEKTEADWAQGMVRMISSKEETAKSIGEKSQQTNFHTVIRLIASSPSELQAETMMNNMVVAFSVFGNEGSNSFQTRRVIPIDSINDWYMLRNYNKRVLETRIFGFGERASILSEEELATIYHLPDGKYNFTPAIRWLPYKKLPAPADLASEGILLGNNVYRGVSRPIFFMKKDRGRHHYIIGKSGTGKSSILSYMIRQDIKNGEGLAVIDPHGDLVDDALNFIPKERVKDVIVFDPADTERPMGMNILEAKTPAEQDLASSQATEIFIKLFGDEIFGPRIQHYFRNACLTLMEDQEEGATLIDVPRIFVDEEFRNYKISKIKNPVVMSFWKHEYAQTGDREKQEMIPYFSAKFGPFITNHIMRNTIGQPKSAFNFRECMDQGKILLVKLSKGKIGDLNTQLLGLIMVARIQMAAMSRADMPENERRDFYLYVDEFQNFATDSFASILSEARKYRLALIMAHQYISQLVVSKSGAQNTQIRDAVFGNVGTITAFKVGADDAEYLAKEFSPAVTEQDLIGISNYKAYVKLNINSTTSRPFSLETIYDHVGENKKVGEIIHEYSRMKYGRKQEFVEQEIISRIGINIEEDQKSDEEKAAEAEGATTTDTPESTTTPADTATSAPAPTTEATPTDTPTPTV